MSASVAAIRLGRLGDLVMTLPALQWLACCEELQVTLITGAHYQQLLAQLLPGVQVVASSETSSLPSFDAVLDLHRHAASRKVRARLWRRRAALTVRVDKQHLLRRSLLRRGPLWQPVLGAVAASLGGHEALRSWPMRHLLAAQELFDRLGLVPPPRPEEVPTASLGGLAGVAAGRAQLPTLGLVLGAGWPLKRWTATGFGTLARQWHDACGGAVRLFAGPGEEDLVDALGVIPGASAYVSGSLLELASGLGECDVVVAGDTGPMHLAAALGRPVVAVFGPTPVDSGFWVWGSRGRVLRGDVPCSPCSLHGASACLRSSRLCLDDLSAAPVLAAALDLCARERRCA
jgi:ADP-heptose:LPS heptosyltransferase